MLTGNYDKIDLKNHINDLISGKIKTLEFYLNFTLDASKDLKKTAKYDSFREEMQEEIYHLDRRMATLKAMQQKMKKVSTSETGYVQLGSLVITNKARFYISVSLGEFFYDDVRFYAISEESPMAQIMKGRETGEEFILNNIHQKIDKIL